MSHELRTPLNAILGFAQLMESNVPPMTKPQQQCIDQILKGGWHLLELVNKILDLTVIESGKLSLSREPGSLTDIVRECLSMTEPLAQRRGIRVTFPQSEISYLVNTDRARLKQILINLLSNAVKYNVDGGTISVNCIARTVNRVRLSVTDSGAGLSPENLAQLFQPFNRLGPQTNMAEGTGIGLVVCKRLIESMGGDIGVASTLGQGSVFWIELDATAEPSSAIVTAVHAAA
jgi:signal transduction histidine kinase